ncbi:DUF4232 domain-containing protein [Kribbella sp. DT2]|uniref:DUF4232 domain-containing protein n=1 Tax=Kribbella sp. DT2 TaxID=3393427 RepID=UPI003CE6B760
MTSDEAKPGEVTFTLAWEADNGALHGVLEAVNVTDHPVRLSSKPGVTPIGLDGEPLSAETVVSLEMRLPGYVELPPGARATSTISWYAWDGPPAGDHARITWPGGEAEAPVTGPSQPTNRDGATNLSSTWFD